jgi:hypothetical protein
MIALAVIGKAFFRNCMKQCLQSIQVASASHLRTVGTVKNEIAEAHLLRQNAA